MRLTTDDLPSGTLCQPSGMAKLIARSDGTRDATLTGDGKEIGAWSKRRWSQLPVKNALVQPKSSCLI